MKNVSATEQSTIISRKFDKSYSEIKGIILNSSYKTVVDDSFYKLFLQISNGNKKMLNFIN